MSLAERVGERLLATTTFPPVPVLLGVGIVCDQITDDSPLIENAFVEMFEAIFRYIPDAYKLEGEEFSRAWYAWPETRYSSPTVPLHDIIDVGSAINQVMVAVCYNQTLMQNGLLTGLRKKIFENEASAHGLSVYERRKKKIPAPWEHDEPPEELCKMYLRGTPFLDFFNTQVPFVIPPKTFPSHGIILAPPNHGKTQLLGSLISDVLRQDNPQVGCFVLDPHGDLFRGLRERVEASRLVVVDPDTNPPPLNFLDFGNSTEAQTLQTFSYLMSSLSGGLSDKQGAIVPYLLKLLRKLQHLGSDVSIETLRLIVDEKVRRVSDSQFFAAISALPAVDQGFFHNQWYTGDIQRTKDAIGWKLYSALSHDTFREMFSAKHNSLTFDKWIEERKVVIVRATQDALGEDGQRVFFQFLLAQYYAAGMRRLRVPENQRHLCIMFCDEASLLLSSPLVAKVLFELRKTACGFIGATQVWDQIGSEIKSAVLGATAIKACGNIQHNDAMVLSREMYCEHTFIRDMKKVEGASFAPWAFYVNGMTDRAVKVRMPFGVLEGMPKRKATVGIQSPSHPLAEAYRGEVPSLPQEIPDDPSTDDDNSPMRRA